MANARLTWTWPTQRELGEVLDQSDILHLEINMSADGGANFSGLAQVPPVAGESTVEHVVSDLNPGTYIFRAVVVDTDNRRSGVAEAGDSILSPPEALADFTVTIE